MNDICQRAHDFDLPVALGGPLARCRNYYPRSTISMSASWRDNELLARLARDCSRPAEQVVFKTAVVIAMSEFPIPL